MVANSITTTDADPRQSDGPSGVVGWSPVRIAVDTALRRWEVWTGVFTGLFAVVPLCSSLHVGRWIDRVGAARVLRRGTLLVLAGAWLPVLKLSIPTLFMMALLLGIGYNLVSMAGLHTAATLGDSGSSRQRLANYGWLGLGFSSSATLGPSIAGVLIDRHGFHVALFCMACCTLVAVALVFTRLGSRCPRWPVAHMLATQRP